MPDAWAKLEGIDKALEVQGDEDGSDPLDKLFLWIVMDVCPPAGPQSNPALPHVFRGGRVETER